MSVKSPSDILFGNPPSAAYRPGKGELRDWMVDTEQRIIRPSSMQWVFLSDGQPLHQSSGDNTHGHDQVAVWRAVMDDIATNFPDARALFHCGDAVDEGRQRDTGQDAEYTLPDYTGDVYSRLPMPRSRVFEIIGNHDRNYGPWDEQQHGHTFHEARRYLAPGFYFVDWGSVRTIHMGDYLPETRGVIPEHVRVWFQRVVFEANAQGKFIIVCTHQPLIGTGLVGASGTSNQEASDWFLNLIQEDGYGVDVWFSGHTGDADDDTDGPNDILYGGCRFININMRIPGAYDAASGVPLTDLHYVVVDFTDGSADVSIKRWNQTDQQYVVADNLTITHGHKIQLAHDPDFNGRLQQDSRHGVREALLPGQGEWLVAEHPRETDRANDVTLASNPFATTDGSTTVTVTDTGHGLATDGSQNGREVHFRDAVDTNGIPAQNLNGTRRVTVVDANTYTFVAAQAATSTGSGGGASIKRNWTWKLLDREPFYIKRIASYAPRGTHVVGMGVGEAVHIPYATSNSGAGEGTEAEMAADLVVQRGFGAAWWAKLLNLSTRACSHMLSATTGPQKSDRVDVLELHPTDGPKALIGSFLYQNPCFQKTEHNDVTLSSETSPYKLKNLASAYDFDIGGNWSSGNNRFECSRDGEVWRFNVHLSLDLGNATDGDVTIYFLHTYNGGASTQEHCKIGFDPNETTGESFVNLNHLIKMDDGDFVEVWLEWSGTPPAKITRTFWGGELVSAGNT